MAWPTDLVRTKNWGTEVLTDSDLEGQFDLIIDWLMAFASETTGHAHTAAENQGPKISLATGITITSMAQGDIFYASSATAIARLGAGTSGQFLKTQGAAANPVWADAGASFSGWTRNLKVTRASASTVTVTADEIILSGAVKSTLSVTIDIAASAGANALDTGSEAANTWYYIWVIRKSSDGTVAGLFSTSSSAPTMPSGYDQKALVSAVRNDNSSNFVTFVQEGTHYWYTTWQTAASGNTAGAWTAIDTTAYVPAAISTIIHGAGEGNATGGSTILFSDNNSQSTTTSTANQPNRVWLGWTLNGFSVFFRIRTTTANTIYWKEGAGTSYMFISGFEINKLGI